MPSPSSPSESASKTGHQRLFALLTIAATLVAFSALSGLEATGGHVGGDDAFISFVYATHLASGEGLVFNPGERVWGFTSPLQTLLLAFAALLGFDVVPLASQLSIVWVALTSLALYALLSRYLSPVAGSLLAFFVLTASLSADGLETRLLIFLLTLFLLLLLADRGSAAALVGSLACLARPDAVLLVVPCLLLSRQGRTLRVLAIFAAPGLLWLAFAYAYYGDVVPNSFHAKSGLTPFTEYIAHQFSRFTTMALPRDLRFLNAGSNTGGLPRAVSLLFLVSLNAGVLLHARIRRTPPLLYALLLYPWVVLLAYGAIGSVKGHNWQVESGRWFFWLSTLVGVAVLLEWALQSSRAERLRPGLRRILGVGAVLLTLALGYSNTRGFVAGLSRWQDQYWGGRRHETYRVVSSWINSNLEAGEVLASREVGTIGFYTDIQLLDIAGIVSRGYEPDERMSARSFVQRFEPRYILLPGSVPRRKFDSSSPRYERIHFFPANGFKSFSLLERDAEGR